MTADKYPGEMKGLKERLLSRFQSGLSVDVQPPNFEVRVAILLDKAEQNGLSLNYDIIEFIARHIKNNVRDLEGAIIRILAKSSLMNKEIDFSLVKDVIKERVGSSFSSNLSIEDIVRKVAKDVRNETGVEFKYLVGTMIELPRACLTADEIAQHAEFFSFGTNDLTQTTFGFSRDDIGSFLPD